MKFFGISPLWWPIGLSIPCCLSSGLKCPPAPLKSGASHTGFWWMCTACSPIGRFFSFTLMVNYLPSLLSLKEAVPASPPLDVLMGTTRVPFFAWACARPACVASTSTVKATSERTETATTERIGRMAILLQKVRAGLRIAQDIEDRPEPVSYIVILRYTGGMEPLQWRVPS